MIGCLLTRVRKQPIIALYFEFETVLKFYNLEARFSTAHSYRRSTQPIEGIPPIRQFRALYFNGGKITIRSRIPVCSFNPFSIILSALREGHASIVQSTFNYSSQESRNSAQKMILSQDKKIVIRGSSKESFTCLKY